ncbi:hypothetical protein BBJ28_00009696 [Nothophytophthora sp. Chile5]|nr:hypothetical protein BBJ28_00009696 [Nothophytophthora sp. Chile5]
MAERSMKKPSAPTGSDDGGLDARVASMPPQSAFMARQAERAHMTGLSPIEELRLAQNELRAKAAVQLPPEVAKLPPPRKQSLHQQLRQSSFRQLVTMRDMIMKVKNRAKVATVRPAESKLTDLDTHRLERDMDELTPAETLDFVESVSKNEMMVHLKKQKYAESVVPKYLISPHGKFRLRWDILSVTLIFCACSFSLSLSLSCHSLHDVQGVNFFSAYEERGQIEVRPKTIAKKYVQSWFLLDFVSAFPLYYFQGQNYRIPQLARLFRLFRLLRRLGLIGEFAVKVLPSLTLLTCLAKSVPTSCFFFLVGYGEEEGWVVSMGLEDKPMYDKYVTSFYWAIMTMTTVGYGDVHPYTTHERIFAITAMVLGAWIFAYGITSVVAMVTNLNAPDSRFQLRMDDVNDYMEARELPVQLRYEIREFFFNARISAESKLVNEGRILAELSALLRSKIAFAINDSVLNKMPFFAGADHNFLMELALSMRMVCFPPMEEVILEGEIGEEMFFIFRGVVEIVKSGIQLGLMGQKQYFGEMAILNQNCLRTATVRTLCFCELRMLTREKFLIALTHYPAMKQRIARIVDKRAKTSQPKKTNSTRTDSSLSGFEKMAASVAIDDKTAQHIAMPTTETTLNRISQLNTEFSGSFRSLTAESELEKIQTKVSNMIQQQDRLAKLMDDLQVQMGDLTDAL